MITPGALVVLTIGHSIRPLNEFIRLLKANGVTSLADIRSVPRSRRVPQFNKDTLPAQLEQAGIKYVHMAGLGGLRRPRADSVNAGWRNASFRGYADYMQTKDFQSNLEELLMLAQSDKVALMCAEAVPWRCHRSLVADALTVRGIRVEHIIGGGERRPHTLTPFAVVRGSVITYPPSDSKVAATGISNATEDAR